MSFYVPPSQMRSLRACMVCSIIQLHSVCREGKPLTFSSPYDFYFDSDYPLIIPVDQKFMREGCPNCEHILGLRGNNDAIQECTSQVFEGLISIADERVSWVARWQRLEGYVPGTYAVKVTGTVCWLNKMPKLRTKLTGWFQIFLQLPPETISSLEDAGIKYIPYVLFFFWWPSTFLAISNHKPTHLFTSTQARWKRRRRWELIHHEKPYRAIK